MTFLFRNSIFTPNHIAKRLSIRQRVEKISAWGIAIVLLSGAGLGLSSCSTDTDTTTTTAHSASTTVTVPYQNKRAANSPTVPLKTPTTIAGASAALSNSTHEASLTPSIGASSPLPQTHLNTKYAPLGVPTMTPPGTFRPFIFTTTFTREQTVHIHDKQLGEKISQTGAAIPLVGDSISSMGNVLAGSAKFASEHDDTCVRAWVELSPGQWGTYATYVTGKECPVKTSHTYQLP